VEQMARAQVTDLDRPQVPLEPVRCPAADLESWALGLAQRLACQQKLGSVLRPQVLG